MHKPFPPLNALRAFEVAARHLSLTKAAIELHVTPGALSHQIRALEDLLGLKLFERGVRSITLTPAGRQLYPGLQAGFMNIRNAVASLDAPNGASVLAISTLPGFTSKWLAPRLSRFASAYPEIDARVSSTTVMANLTTSETDVAVRNLPLEPALAPGLVMEQLIEICFVPVCSPRLIEAYGPFTARGAFKGAPLIHDDSFADRNGAAKWSEWFEEAGLPGADISRGLRFNSADHALDAAIEGAGVLLAPDALAYDDLRAGRLALAADVFLRSGRAYYFMCAEAKRAAPNVCAFHGWIKQEVALMDWTKITTSIKRG